LGHDIDGIMMRERDVVEDVGGPETKKPPGSHIWGLWLRETHDNSN
jgi:hypothetical protein